jgi:DNA-binding XRE family transcriptional regulator
LRQHGDPNRDYAGEWLRWRKEHGLTQEQEAQALGITRKTIRDIEKGKHPPKLGSREKMAALQQRYREAEKEYHDNRAD